LFAKWIKCNGPHWTVKRIKSLKIQLISIIAGNNFDKNWIAYKGSYPRGPLKPLFKRAISDRKYRKRVLSVLNSYLAFTDPPDEIQESVYNNISKPISSNILKQINHDWGRFTLTNLQEKSVRTLNHHLHRERVKLNINAGLNTGKPFVKGENQWIKSMQLTAHKILPTELITRDYHFPKTTLDVEEYGGELISLFERGNKVRVIASPHAELQIGLEPFHKALNKVLHLIPEDCTFDQEKGAIFAQECLKSGLNVHSVDLSAATDRFPLHFQMSVIRKLVSHEIHNWCSVFERSASLKWKSPYGDITYGAGQPMGLYGSFPVFAISHHSIVRTLCKELKIPLINGLLPYRILGDDIIIANDDLAREYKNYILSLGVSISETKTITSTNLAEFAGYIIDRKGYYKPPKVPKDGLTIPNLINYLKVRGGNPYPESHPFYKVCDLLMYLPTPYGAGINPGGLTYKK
jgi:hypothetical protein